MSKAATAPSWITMLRSHCCTVDSRCATTAVDTEPAKPLRVSRGKEAIRALKRRLSDVFYRAMVADLDTTSSRAPTEVELAAV